MNLQVQEEEEQIQEQHQEEEDEMEIEELLHEEVIDNEEKVQQYFINYVTNLPIEATAQSGRRERRNQPGLVELNG